LPFIENCFKHGISSQHESKISISLEKKGNELILGTQNSIFGSTENTPEGEASGIGLVNTTRRLDLLYPGNHKLKIEGTVDNQYIVYLKINLK
jgi:sensor histidine kinase YesM